MALCDSFGIVPVLNKVSSMEPWPGYVLQASLDAQLLMKCAMHSHTVTQLTCK